MIRESTPDQVDAALEIAPCEPTSPIAATPTDQRSGTRVDHRQSMQRARIVITIRGRRDNGDEKRLNKSIEETAGTDRFRRSPYRKLPTSR